MYRIQEINSGSILIDGYDITKIPLQVLRKRLAIIPQDPTLFSGTIRFNLDPFDEYSDDNIFTVLKHVCLFDYIDSLEGKLLEVVREKGENFSQGQKQLLCIGRALLMEAKVLLIDEGTSACDPHTDKLIQDILKKFVIDKGMTLLTIAHRLQTIIDYDKILGNSNIIINTNILIPLSVLILILLLIVLGDGEVKEFDTPDNLIKKDSMFASMLKE